MTRFLHVVALLLTALALAPALAHAAERPGKLRLDRATYTAVQPIYYPGFTILGCAEPASIVALGLLLPLTPTSTAPFWLFVAAIVALAAMQATYWAVTHPINRVWLRGQRLSRAGGRFFAAGTAGTEADRREPGWEELRQRWESSHVVRALCAAVALALVAVAVAL